jgi:hypothetical protein
MPLHPKAREFAKSGLFAADAETRESGTENDLQIIESIKSLRSLPDFVKMQFMSTFKHGDTRDDGYRFWSYQQRRGKRTEKWLSPEAWNNQIQSRKKWRERNKEKINTYYRKLYAKNHKKEKPTTSYLA